MQENDEETLYPPPRICSDCDYVEFDCICGSPEREYIK